MAVPIAQNLAIKSTLKGSEKHTGNMTISDTIFSKYRE
jgi:hypothetical protein